MFSYNMFLFQDMDLIEVLWKQDVDLGFSLEMPGGKSMKATDNLDTKPPVAGPTTSVSLPDDDIEKLKTLEALNNEALKVNFEPFNYNHLRYILIHLRYILNHLRHIFNHLRYILNHSN